MKKSNSGVIRDLVKTHWGQNKLQHEAIKHITHNIVYVYFSSYILEVNFCFGVLEVQFANPPPEGNRDDFGIL